MGKKGIRPKNAWALQNIRKKGWNKTNTINFLEKNESEEEINRSNYFIFTIRQNIGRNPFCINGTIVAKQIKILIDTGADMTLIARKFLPKNTMIKSTEQRSSAANRSQIPIIGRDEDLAIEVRGRKIMVAQDLITSVPMKYISLSAPEIQRNPVILFSILPSKEKSGKNSSNRA